MRFEISRINEKSNYIQSYIVTAVGAGRFCLQPLLDALKMKAVLTPCQNYAPVIIFEFL